MILFFLHRLYKFVTFCNLSLSKNYVICTLQFMWTCVVVITYRFSPKKLLSMKTQVQFGLSSVIAKRLFLKYSLQPHIFPLATFIWTHMIVLGLFSCCAVLSVGRHQLKFFESHNIFFILILEIGFELQTWFNPMSEASFLAFE